ncbi:MAG: LPS-assembly protein LptD [Deltaproteobacteria bacterium]|nr:MAG: LPS-assembly protein LptD [Deltaproteobacteria bacterium]
MLRVAATAALAVIALARPVRAQNRFFAGPPGSEVEIAADRISYAWEKQLLQLKGHVVARRGPGLLRAGSGTLDRARGVLWLEGGVLGVQDRQVFLADAAVVDLNSHTAELSKAVLFLKERPANPDAPRSGANTLTLHAARVRQLQRGRFLAEDVSLTPCDCAGEPDYELWARTAEIGDDRADLRGVRLHLLGAALPLFPLSLPLTNRQSGLLAPVIGYGGPIGFTYAQPIFLTLGRSYDVTVAPGWYTGGHAHQEAPGLRSIKGPRLGLEGRYAPVEGTSGSLALDLFYDLDQHDPGGAGPGRGYGGARGIAHLAHRTEAGGATFAGSGIAVSDVMALRDQAAQSIENSYDLFTTDVGLWSARGPLTVGADATLMQDMRIANPAVPDRRLFGRDAGTTFQRLPAVFAQLAPTPIGPATFAVEASAVQFGRFGKPDSLERTTGFGLTDRAIDPQVGSGDPSRAPALRLDLAPRITLSGSPTFPVDLRLEGGGRVDGWILEGYSDRNRTRAYALLGASAALPLERRYGSALHRIEPAFAVRALSKPLQSGGPPIGDLTDAGGSTFAARPDNAEQGLGADQRPELPLNQRIAGVPASRRPYDEIDSAAPASGAVEATASISQSVWTRPGRTAGRILRFDLLQDALLWAGGGRARLGEGSAVASVQVGSGNLTGAVRYDWSLHEISAFGASAGIRDPRGDEVHTSIQMLRGASSERLRGGIDELFSAARFASASSALTGSANAGVSGPLPLGLRLAYDVTHTPGDTPVDFANWTHAVSVTLETPCRCAGLQLSASVPFHDLRLLRAPGFAFRIDLKSLGSFATF